VESAYGTDFGAVRIHADPAAHALTRALGARAFTAGADVFLASDAAPTGVAARGLIAHELAHVVQQRRGVAGVAPSPERDLEYGAATAARAVVAGETAVAVQGVAPPGAVQFQKPGFEPTDPAAWELVGRPSNRKNFPLEYIATLEAAAPSEQGLVATLERLTLDAGATRLFAGRFQRRLTALGRAVSPAMNVLVEPPDPTQLAREEVFARTFRTLVRMIALDRMAEHRRAIVNRRKALTASVKEAPSRTAADVRRVAADIAKLNKQREELVANRHRLLGVQAEVLTHARTDKSIQAWVQEIEDNAVKDSGDEMLEYLNSQIDALNATRYLDATAPILWKMSMEAARRRGAQIGGIDLALRLYYDEFPFFAGLRAEDVGEPALAKDAALFAASDKAFADVLERLDKAIVTIGSADIDAYSLPAAIDAARKRLSPNAEANVGGLLRDHQTTEFWTGWGGTALTIALVLIPVVGPAIGIALGVAQFGMSVEDMMDRQLVATSEAAPQPGMLGVQPPGVGEYALRAVELALLAVDIKLLRAEFKAANAVDMDIADLVPPRPTAGAPAKPPVPAQRTAAAATTEVEKIGAVNAETQSWLGLRKQDALRLELIESPAAARALRKCGSLCFPPGLQPHHVERLERVLKRVGTYDEEMVRNYLYSWRSDIETGINFLEAAQSPRDFAGRIAWRMEKGKIVFGPGPEELTAFKVQRSAELGVTHGKTFSGQMGLNDVGFQNPFEHIGGHGQGFDDIRIKGTDIYKDEVYCIDYKGGIGGQGAVIPGQLDLDWVVKNIRRLYLEGGAQGQKWAIDLAKALREGRLKGIMLGTPVEAGLPGATKVITTWTYPPTVIAF
jgi:hypothetical protein